MGTRFVLIENTSTNPVSGSFADLSEGTTLTLSGTRFRISYRGGAGSNDVVLTQISAPPAPVINHGPLSVGGQFTFTGNGNPGWRYAVQATTNLAPGSWVNVGSTTAGTNGGFQFSDKDSGRYPQRFYRLMIP